jgi:general secretion pathway protein I
MMVPSPSAADRGQAGFTLIEMLVALVVFSLAALALLRLSGASATNSALIREQTLAAITARGLAAETLTDPAPPAFGTETGQVVNGNRRWVWTRVTGRSPEARIQQIEIRVTAEAGPAAARLVIFRRIG